jgi:uncharacterized protein
MTAVTVAEITIEQSFLLMPDNDISFWSVAAEESGTRIAVCLELGVGRNKHITHQQQSDLTFRLLKTR